MLKALGEIGKGIVLAVLAAIAAPIMAISELIQSFSSFIG